MTEFRRADEIAADNTKDPLDKIAELACQDLGSFMNMLYPPTHREIVDYFMGRMQTFASDNSFDFSYMFDMNYQTWRLRFIKLTRDGKACVEYGIIDESLRSLSAADYIAGHVICEVKRECEVRGIYES